MTYRNYVEGGGPPLIDHSTRGDALAEAQRLSKLGKGDVLTLEVIARTRVEQIVIQHDYKIGTVQFENDQNRLVADESSSVSMLFVEHDPGVDAACALFGIPEYSEKWSF